MLAARGSADTRNLKLLSSLNPRMKLRQNGTVSFSIKLAASQASGWAERGTLNLEPFYIA